MLLNPILFLVCFCFPVQESHLERDRFDNAVSQAGICPNRTVTIPLHGVHILFVASNRVRWIPTTFEGPHRHTDHTCLLVEEQSIDRTQFV